MAKIGTAHIEVKPVLNEDTLDDLAKQIQERVASAVEAGIKEGLARVPIVPVPAYPGVYPYRWYSGTTTVSRGTAMGGTFTVTNAKHDDGEPPAAVAS